MANDTSSAPGIDSASRTDRQRTGAGESFLFPAQTAKGDARLLEAVKRAAPGQRTGPSDACGGVEQTP